MNQLPFEVLGYSIARPIEAGERFHSYELERDGGRFFGKVAQNEKLHPLLSNELWWNQTIERLVAADLSFPFRSPRTLASGPGWLVTEFYSGSKLLPNGGWTAQAARPLRERLISMIVALDGQLRIQTGDEPLYEDSESAPYTHLLKKIDAWMERPLQAGLITPARVTQAKGLIEKYRSFIRPGFAHGDFVPWHMFNLGEGLTGVIDGEHASLVKPRYYDLAYLTSRLWTTVYAAEEARAILQTVLDRWSTDTPEFAQAYLPVITQRALGMHFDALNDFKRTDQWQKDYRREAQELLDACLTERLEELL